MTAIVADTSAIVAVVLGEPDAMVFVQAMRSAIGEVDISSATLVEARIVVEARQGREAVADLDLLLRGIGAHIVPFDAEQADIAFAAWRRFGKGRHPAQLNLGDCFSYALARQSGAPLLFKGDDFAQTDIASAL